MTTREQRLDAARRWAELWSKSMRMRACMVADVLDAGCDVTRHLARYVRARDHYVDAINRCIANHPIDEGAT